MKKVLLALSAIITISSCSTEPDSNFTIDGKIADMRKGTVYLSKIKDGDVSLQDSVFLKGTEDFKFKGYIESPEVFYISSSRKNSSYLPVFVEKGEIIIDADIKDIMFAEISGSKNQELLDNFNKIIGRFNLKEKELYFNAVIAKNKNNIESYNSINTAYTKNEKRKSLFILNFAVVNGDYDVSPYIALNYLSQYNLSVLDTVSSSMSETVKGGKYGLELNKYILETKNNEKSEKSNK